MTQVVYFLLQVGLLLFLLKEAVMFIWANCPTYYLYPGKKMFSGVYWNQPVGPSINVKMI